MKICNKSGVHDYCKQACIHSREHDPVENTVGAKCTEWGKCNIPDIGVAEITVRCVNVRDELIRSTQTERRGGCDEITWCEDDADGHSVKYVREE